MYTVPGFDAPAMFPSNSVMTWRPLLSTGSLGMVPPLQRYYGTLRLPAVRLDPFDFFTSRYHRVAHGLLPSVVGVPPAHWGRFFPSPRGKLFMLSLLNNSFNSRPRLGIPLLGQGKLAFDQQGQDDSDPLAETATRRFPPGVFRPSLGKVGGGKMGTGFLGPLVGVGRAGTGTTQEVGNRNANPLRARRARSRSFAFCDSERAEFKSARLRASPTPRGHHTARRAPGGGSGNGYQRPPRPPRQHAPTAYVPRDARACGERTRRARPE